MHNPHPIKRSLVLAGGGMRVAYQSGVIIALREAGLTFSHVDGTSGGTFNTAMLASKVEPKQMAENWRTLQLKDFVSGRKFKNYLRLFKMQGFADADNIRKKVFPHLGIDIQTIKANAHINATFNVCNFHQKEVVTIPHKDATQDHLIAGVSLPIFMPAIKINQTWFTDAVWIKDANLIESVNQGSKELWLIWAIGNTPSYLSGAFNQYVHMIEMSANGGLLEEFKQIKKDQANKDVKLFVVKSDIPLPLDPDFFFNKINARELVNMGYAQAKNYVANRPDQGENMDTTATQCLEPESTLSIRNVFFGQPQFGNNTLTFFSYLRLSLLKNKTILKVFSSIKFQNEPLEIPIYGHEYSTLNENSRKLLCVKAHFLLHKKTMTIVTKEVLQNPLETIIGLGFKKIFIQIFDELNNKTNEGYLYQSIWSRIKSVYFTSIISAKFKTFKSRYLMHKLLANLEI